MADLRLDLYVVGNSPSAKIALANLRRICEERLGNAYALQVVDVLENPEAAEEANIVATPTLIKRDPPPVRRIIGDLSATETVLRSLDIDDEDVKHSEKERSDE